MGKRLGELTRDNTKCMVSVNGVKLIDRMLTQLSLLSLNRVVIVVGYQGQKLIDHIGDRYKDKLNIEYIHNPIYDKTNNIYSLALAKQQLSEDDTLLLESDLIFDNAMLDLIISDPYPNLALVAKYESWMNGTVVRISEDNSILNFIPKETFNYAESHLYYKTVNIYKFSKEFSKTQYVPFLEAYCTAMGNNEYYEQVLRIITIINCSDLKALPITNQKWYEIDDSQDLDIAETLFSSDEELLNKYYKRYGGYWRFPQLKDFCYLVNPYFPTPKMKDELKANFDVLLSEYPSGMYVNSLLAGKYFGIDGDYVVVGNGAAELIKSYIENHVKENIGIIYPTFQEYPNRVVNAERIVQFIPNNSDYSYTADNVKAFYSDKEISALLIINPDNPSGNFIPLSQLMLLIEWAKERGVTMIVDESFVDFTENFQNNSLLHNDILEKYDNLLVVKSISKSYGVPGLRLGVLASGNRKLIDNMKKEVAIWNINSFAEFYMQNFGKYTCDYTSACEKLISERNKFFEELKDISFLRVIPSQANYFLCEVTDRYSATELSFLLLKRYNVLVKDCGTKSAFYGKNYIRIAIRNRADNAYLVNVLKTLDKCN